MLENFSLNLKDEMSFEAHESYMAAWIGRLNERFTFCIFVNPSDSRTYLSLRKHVNHDKVRPYFGELPPTDSLQMDRFDPIMVAVQAEVWREKYNA